MNSTDAEVKFVWDIINKFKPLGRMDSGTFTNWGVSMENRDPKTLMYYGQYLGT